MDIWIAVVDDKGGLVVPFSHNIVAARLKGDVILHLGEGRAYYNDGTVATCQFVESSAYITQAEPHPGVVSIC